MNREFHIAYCFPAGDQFLTDAFSFLQTYLAFPAQVEHTLVLLTDPGYEQTALDMFSVAADVVAVATPDHAKDLSRYQAYSKQCQASCLMMLGGSSYARRPGWGLRALTAFRTLGPNAILGACGHTGAGPVHRHIRTTGWWTSPALLRQFPYWPTNIGGRYQMEHGQGTSLTAWADKMGYKSWAINFGSEYTLDRANDDPDGYGGRNKTHANLLIGDRLTRPPYANNP